MSASPQTVDTAPLFLTSNTNVHNARDFRRQFSDMVGSGVADQDSFRIRQRAAGANMSVDCMTASTPNRAFVRGSITVDAGMYRVYFNNATPVNLDIATADATNPRIDRVYLCVEDSQETGANNLATVRVVTGTPTATASLDNLLGIGAAPTMSCILLADILVAAAAASIVNASIRDRRPFGVRGALPSPFTTRDIVAFEPVPFATSGTNIQGTATADAQQSAALMFLPRRIVLATKFKFKATQGGTANLTNSAFGIYDASGRQIVLTTPAVIGGTANQQTAVDLTITATTFEVGYYWIWNGEAAGTVAGTIQAYACVGSTATFLTGPNQFAYATSGGTTAPTTILNMTDLWTITGAAVTVRLGVPVPALSVG